MRRPYNGSYPITRQFGVYDAAYANYPGSRHPGTDYGTPENTPLVASITGTVKIFNRGNTATGRGNEVNITNGNTTVKYCHLNRIDVVDGQLVVEGQQVGLAGWTGYVLPKSPSGSHLHFETLINGVYVNPEEQYGKESNVAIVQDSENWYGRLNKLHMQTLNAPLGRDVFKNLVGWDTLKVIELFSDHSVAAPVQAAQEWAMANRTIVEAKIKDLTAQNAAKDQQIKDLQAKLAIQSEDTQLLNGFGDFLRKLIVRLGLKG